MPVIIKQDASAAARTAFENAFDQLYDALQGAPTCWTLFDFHSPNVMWLEEKSGIARIGLLDFQDTRRGPQAYDLVSLTQDARVSVSAALEQELLKHYIDGQIAKNGSFDTKLLSRAYAICGAQRATRILGVFCAPISARWQKPLSQTYPTRIRLS